MKELAQHKVVITQPKVKSKPKFQNKPIKIESYLDTVMPIESELYGQSFQESEYEGTSTTNHGPKQRISETTLGKPESLRSISQDGDETLKLETPHFNCQYVDPFREYE